MTEENNIIPGHTMGFWKLACSFWGSKMIVVDSDEFFSGNFKNNFQETLLLPVHAVSRGNNNSIINEDFNR